MELGEIESALCCHPSIREAAVVVRQEPNLGRLVLAYVVRVDGELELPDGLRAFLRQTLPDYMIPAAVVPLPMLPLAPGGKVDRKGLASRQFERTSADVPEAPRTELETVVAEVWEEILGVSGIGVHDDLFRLGANSLHAIRAGSRLERRLGVRLPLNLFFEHPTPGALAGVIESTGEGGEVATATEYDTWEI